MQFDLAAPGVFRSMLPALGAPATRPSCRNLGSKTGSKPRRAPPAPACRS